MPEPTAAELAKIIFDGFIQLTDHIAIEAMAIANDEPRRADGKPSDPYTRGFVDGMDALSTGIRDGAKQAAAQFGVTDA